MMMPTLPVSNEESVEFKTKDGTEEPEDKILARDVSV